MTEKRNNIPSVLLIILSALGIFVSAGIAVLSFFGIALPSFSDSINTQDIFAISSICVLSLVVCGLTIGTMVIAIQSIKGKNSRLLKQPSVLLKVMVPVIWVIVLSAGYFISQREDWVLLLAPITPIAILLPIWWLIVFAQSGLPRCTSQRESGTLTIATLVAPPIIIIVEMISIIAITLIVMIALGFNGNFSSQLPSLFENLGASGGINELENLLFGLMRDPIIATAVFVSLGVIAPLIEEGFKPMAIWFLLKRPLHNYEGYILGLISGGAFALLESAGMVIQMDYKDWLPAIFLRAATGVLHIGLSGLVGFGLVKSWNSGKRGRSILYLFGATVLHGLWNSLAIASGLASLPLAGTENTAGSSIGVILSVAVMVTIFFTLILINFFINRSIRKTIKLNRIPNEEMEK